MRFAELQVQEKEQALRAGLARFVVHRADVPEDPYERGEFLGRLGHTLDAAVRMADPSFSNTSTMRWVGYSRAILHNGERQSNRAWESYPEHMQVITKKIADHLEAYVRV
jgi:hypothetical protein